MRLKTILDFISSRTGVKSVATIRHDERTSRLTQQDRLGFGALRAAAQMDRLGFLYAPLKLDPDR